MSVTTWQITWLAVYMSNSQMKKVLQQLCKVYKGVSMAEDLFKSSSVLSQTSVKQHADSMKRTPALEVVTATSCIYGLSAEISESPCLGGTSAKNGLRMTDGTTGAGLGGASEMTLGTAGGIAVPEAEAIGVAGQHHTSKLPLALVNAEHATLRVREAAVLLHKPCWQHRRVLTLL